MPWITITAEDGKLNIDLEGFQGQGCGDIARLFDELGTRTETRRKPEFHRDAPTDTEVRRITR